ADLEGVRILVVGGNATSRRMIQSHLASWRMRPADADDGATALQALADACDQGEPFRFALVDQQLPGMDGLTLGHTIKVDPRLAGTILVLTSPLSTHIQPRQLVETGFADSLIKPLRYSELYNALVALLVPPVPSGTHGSGSPPAAAALGNRPGALPGLQPGTARRRVLLVEDNPTNQIVAQVILKKLGLHSDTASNGVEALELLGKSAYDLVLMDMQMPVMDGLEATRRIRDSRSAVLDHGIPIIAMTANAMEDDRRRCFDVGMNDYVTKPIKPEALSELLARWMPVAVDEGEGPALYDGKDMRERLMDDGKLVKIVLSCFLEDMPAEIRKLKELVEAGEASEAGHQAHKIKGAAANISAPALRALAGGMEERARKGDLPALRGLIGELERQFELLRRCLLEEIREAPEAADEP
ncbi:MAG: response regulator, partial [Spirochaetota bacterium]